LVEEIKIVKMFREISEPFNLYKSVDRYNFLNYRYVLSKICKILNMDTREFYEMRNNNKLQNHNNLWKYICEYRNWQYEATEPVTIEPVTIEPINNIKIEK
jgi:hypothetical protein